MRALTIGLVSACFIASPSLARTLTMPTSAEMHLLRSYLQASPPDFEAIASRSDVARSATEFDKAETVARESERLREAYVGIGEVDRIIIRLDSDLSRYDGAAGGFRLRALEPDRYVAFNHEKLLFENSSAFAVWKLTPSEGRRVLEEVGSGRSVQIEIEAVPFAASPTDRLAVRVQIRTLRIATRDGVTLGEMRSEDPEAERVLPGHAARSSVPEERLEVLGLRVGATYDEFRRWVADRGFESDTIDGPLLQKWRYELDFAAEPGVIPPPSDMPMPPKDAFWAPMPIVGEKFACEATDPTRRICGAVTFSPDPAVEDKAITSIRIAQTIGSKPDTVRASLVEKFGPPSDDFPVTLPTWNGDVEARQVVWGTPKPRNDDTLGSTALTNAGKTWQIEAIIVDRGSGGTVLIVQVSGAPAETSDAPAEARL